MKQAIKGCKQGVETILKVLRPHSMAVDAELLIVPEAAQKLLKTSLSYAELETVTANDVGSLLNRLSDLITHHSAQLELMHKDTAGFIRLLQSPRIHHALFIRNTLIYQYLNSVVEVINSFNRTKRSKSNSKTTKGKTGPSTMLGAFASCSIDTGLESPSAIKFWLKHWPNDDYLVPWALFQAALLTEFPTASLKSLSGLQYFLDFSHTSMVSKSRLNTLVKLAPSFEELVSFPSILLSKPWFVGHMSKNEATLLLQQEPLNTFLVRLHKNGRSILACSYTSTRGVQHHVIVREKYGYSMSHCAGTFGSIDELITHNSFLKQEFGHLWLRSNYFLGEATKEEAEAMLEGSNEGVYVVRLQVIPPSSGTPPLGPLNGASTSIASSGGGIGDVNNLSSGSIGSNGSSGSSNALGTSNIASATTIWRDVSFVISVNSTAGQVRHLLVPRDGPGNFIVGSKSYSDLTGYLESHKVTFSMPFSPSLPKFRARLDARHSPSVPASGASSSHGPHTSAASRFSASLNISSSSQISLSSSVGIPLTISVESSDFSASPSAVSRDDLTIPTSPIGHNKGGSHAIIHDPDDDLPILQVDSLAISPSLCSELGTGGRVGVGETVGSPANIKRKWKPLTHAQLNPLNITYKDMWAELLRYYHVPVPEAKIPPKTMDKM